MDNSKRSMKKKLAEDVRRLTHAATSKWKIGLGGKRKHPQQLGGPSVLVKSVSCDAALCAKINSTAVGSTCDVKERSEHATRIENQPQEQSERKAKQRSPKKKNIPLPDVMMSLGKFVLSKTEGLTCRPTVADVVGWMRQADRALQLNGWTVNSFLIESHVVFTFMLMQAAFEQFAMCSLLDLKEVFYLCLYISYTYNANEISYPLRPFLVKSDRVGFWDKCTGLSLSISDRMLKINNDRDYYEYMLHSLLAYAH